MNRKFHLCFNWITQINSTAWDYGWLQRNQLVNLCFKNCCKITRNLFVPIINSVFIAHQIEMLRPYLLELIPPDKESSLQQFFNQVCRSFSLSFSYNHEILINRYNYDDSTRPWQFQLTCAFQFIPALLAAALTSVKFCQWWLKQDGKWKKLWHNTVTTWKRLCKYSQILLFQLF